MKKTDLNMCTIIHHCLPHCLFVIIPHELMAWPSSSFATFCCSRRSHAAEVLPCIQRDPSSWCGNLVGAAVGAAHGVFYMFIVFHNLCRGQGGVPILGTLLGFPLSHLRFSYLILYGVSELGVVPYQRCFKAGLVDSWGQRVRHGCPSIPQNWQFPSWS